MKIVNYKKQIEMLKAKNLEQQKELIKER